MSRVKQSLTFVILSFAAILVAAAANSSQQANREVIVWSWDYPDDLSFIKPDDKVKIAYYAGTIYLREGHAFLRARTKALKLPQNVLAYPVIRIESDGAVSRPSELSQSVSKMIERVVLDKKAQSVQIDFDARQSEQQFYTALLKSTRKTLPAKTHIGITALLSWFDGSDWLKDLDADQKTAMCFSLGKNPGASLAAIAALKQRPDAIGISVYEKETNKKLSNLGLLDSSHSVYLFSAIPWRQATYIKARSEAL